MVLYHLTPKSNAAQVRWQGLRISCAVGVPRVWFFTAAKREWALSHIAKHKHCKSDDLIEFIFNVPRSWLVRWRRGIWLCYRDVPAMLCKSRDSVRDFLDLGGSDSLF